MGVMGRVRAAVSELVAKERRLSLGDGSGWAALFGFSGAAGKAVTHDSTLQLSTAWACIRTTAQAAGSMPAAVYRKLPDGGREEAGDHELAEVLVRSPNADQTPQEFVEGLAAWLVCSGNAYALKDVTGPRLSSLHLLSGLTTAAHRKRDGTLVYRFVDRGKREEVPPEKVLHVRGFGFGGDAGLSPIRYGVQTFSSAIALDESAGKMFVNGLMPSGMVSTERVLDATQRAQVRGILQEYAGSSRAGKAMLLEGGFKFEQLSLNPEDAQMLETRRFTVEEICRWFGMPPIVIGHAGQGQTMWGSGVEQILLAWLTLGLNPILRRIETRIAKDLVPARDRGRVYAEFNREGLLQADSAAKAAFLSTLGQNGYMTRNEGRKKLNLAPKPGGDVLTVQSNLLPLDRLGQAGGDAQQMRAAMRAFLGLDSEAKP